MKSSKNDVVQFFIWMRNGFAFCTSWLLILWVFYNRSTGTENISTDSLINLMLFVTGGVLIFALMFTRIVIKRWSFLQRLTCFVVLISVYECVAFYLSGFWQTSGSPAEWFGFVGLILILYLLCIGIYRIYSKKQGQVYTQALQSYQEKRREQNEK